MGLFSKAKNQLTNQTISHIDLVTERGSNFFAWNGNVYQSDIVKSCVRPRAVAIGKLVATHIRETVVNGEKNIAVNPEPYIRFLLEDPNPIMSMQKLLEKMGAQLCINSNAFALIVKDEMGIPISIMPISCISAEAIYSATGELFIKFRMENKKTFTFAYSDIIHIREDYNENDIFGTPKIKSLAPLMEIVTTTDQGIVNAIKNSSIIRWLLKYTTSTRPEDIEKETKRFANSFLSIENGTGVAGVDSKADAIQIKPEDYVPNAATMDKTTQRIYGLLSTNEKIVHSSFGENEWNSYYEAQVENVAIDLKCEFTRKIFSRTQRSFGNSIVFDASNLACASITTRLALVAMVDRGALTPNEWRATFNLAPVEGGDKPLRRLDTQVVEKGGESK